MTHLKKTTGPALAVLELESISRGFLVADALVKKAPIQWVMAEAVSPGKFVLIFSGQTAETEAAYLEGIEQSENRLLDKLFLPYAADALFERLSEAPKREWKESIGIIETHTVASTILAADTAIKTADVRLMELQLASGIGGKGYFTLTGALDMVEAAVESAAAAIAPHLLMATEIIQKPHPELRGVVF